MLRPVLLSLAAFLLCTAAQSAEGPRKSALDKATLEAYVRHLYVMDPKTIQVQISDPKPSALPGFVEETVHASSGERFQDITFYISKDGSKIVLGNVLDTNSNPFKTNLEKLKTENTPNIGTAGATVVIVEFSDFECPYCKQEATMLRQNLLTTYPKQVRLYFKTFPLESVHPWAKAAAMAGGCAYKQNNNAFWSYHDWIFDHQAEITAENLKDKVMGWAKGEKDVDAMQLGECMDSKATAKDVDQNLELGRQLGVNSTPTLFVNGRPITQTIDWPSLHAIIDYEVEYQKTAKNAGEDCGCELKLDLPGAPAMSKPLDKK